MATEFHNDESTQVVPLKDQNHEEVKAQELSLRPVPKQNFVEFTFEQTSIASVETLRAFMTYDELWEHVHNCLYALNALKGQK